MAEPGGAASELRTIDMSYLEGTVGYALRRAQMAVFSDIYRSFGDDGMTLTKFSILAIVADNPDINQAALAEALGVERPRMVPLLNGLEKEGLVTRVTAHLDRRNKCIQLTPNGFATLSTHKERFAKHQAKLRRWLRDDDLQQVLSLLWRIANLPR